MFARMGIRGWIILALVAVLGGVNLWIFFFRSQKSPTLASSTLDPLPREVAGDSKESPSNSTSKKGTGSDPAAGDTATNPVPEVPVPGIQQPFDFLGDLLNWEAFAGVDPPPPAEFTTARALQVKVNASESLTPAEVDRLVDLSQFHKDSPTQARALSALTELGVASPAFRDKAIDAICAALKDPNWLVVSYAASGLAKLDAKDKVPFLVPLLKHPEFRVRQKAQESLDHLGYGSGS